VVREGLKLVREWGRQVLVVLAVMLMAGTAAASVYGEGPYSGCTQDEVCVSGTPSPSSSVEPAPDSTVGVTPLGLRFAVNLANGQVVPRPSYVVTVTPLNGDGRTFERVEFYLDGRLVASAVPDSTGTASWTWPTAKQLASRVRVVVYDGAEPTALEFRVTVQAAATPAGGLGLLSPAMAAELRRLVRQIPVPVARTFPYLLFALLGVALLVLLAQARREAAHNLALQRLVQRERIIAEEKTTFIQLVSHYLRTPLTLVLAGADMAVHLQPGLAPEVASRLMVAVEAVRTTVEGLLKRVNDSTLLAGVPDAQALPPNLVIWRSPSFWLPIGLITLITMTFNYLVAVAGDIDVGLLNSLMQGVTLGLLALGLYVLLRGRRVRRFMRQAMQQTAEHQQAVDKVRADFIEAVAAELAAGVRPLREVLSQIEVVPLAAKSIDDAYGRYLRLIASCEVAGKLRTGGTQAPFEPVSLLAMMNEARMAMAGTADAKGVIIAGETDVAFACQHPAWLTKVLASVLDNAVAYSKGPSRVIVAGTAGNPAVITVQDSGRGIAPQQLAQLFQPFYKAEGALNFDHEGAGLSLFVDRLVMHYLGGEISIESQVGRGSRVSLRFPTA
jgi:signal transduction histidine kinase